MKFRTFCNFRMKRNSNLDYLLSHYHDWHSPINIKLLLKRNITIINGINHVWMSGVGSSQWSVNCLPYPSSNNMAVIPHLKFTQKGGARCSAFQKHYYSPPWDDHPFFTFEKEP